MADSLLGKVVAISIGLFLAAIMLPMALVEMANATLTGVEASVVTIVQVLLPVLGTIAVALHFLKDVE